MLPFVQKTGKSERRSDFMRKKDGHRKRLEKNLTEPKALFTDGLLNLQKI